MGLSNDYSLHCFAPSPVDDPFFLFDLPKK